MKNPIEKDFSRKERIAFQTEPNYIPVPQFRYYSLPEFSRPIDKNRLNYKQSVVAAYIYKGGQLLVNYHLEERILGDYIIAEVFLGEIIGTPFCGRFVWMNDIPDISGFFTPGHINLTPNELNTIFKSSKRMLTEVFPPPEGKTWIQGKKEGRLLVPGHYE